MTASAFLSVSLPGSQSRCVSDLAAALRRVDSTLLAESVLARDEYSSMIVNLIAQGLTANGILGAIGRADLDDSVITRTVYRYTLKRLAAFSLYVNI